MSTISLVRNKTLGFIYLLIFLLNLHVALPAYISSSFIETFVGGDYVGLIFTGGAILSVIALAYLPILLNKFGNFRTSVVLTALQLASILILALSRNALFVAPFFIATLALVRLIGFNIDIFLEKNSNDEETGGIRGWFLEATNLAWVISPLLAGWIMSDSQFYRVYLASILFLLPLFPILFKRFSRFEDPDYEVIKMKSAFSLLDLKDNIRKIVFSSIILRLFYSWMIIYTPIYLNQHIGFEWSKVGLILSIMLIPFVLLDVPLGWLADKKLGEKELLTAGFIITAVFTSLVSFVDSREVLVWAGILFGTRIGAAMVEMMVEAYFFKKIDSRDSNLLGILRMTGPFSYIVGPLIASVIFSLIGIQYMFVILAAVVLFGVRYSLAIEDTF